MTDKVHYNKDFAQSTTACGLVEYDHAMEYFTDDVDCASCRLITIKKLSDYALLELMYVSHNTMILGISTVGLTVITESSKWGERYRQAHRDMDIARTKLRISLARK